MLKSVRIVNCTKYWVPIGWKLYRNDHQMSTYFDRGNNTYFATVLEKVYFITHTHLMQFFRAEITEKILEKQESTTSERFLILFWLVRRNGNLLVADLNTTLF